MGFNSKINWSKDFTLDNSTTFHSEYEKKSGVTVAPYMLSVPGFVKTLFSRKFVDTGPLVLSTVVVDGPTAYSASCNDDLILFRIGVGSNRVTLPFPSVCPGGLFIIKDDLGIASPTTYIEIEVDSGPLHIDGLRYVRIQNQGGAIWLMSDGTNYRIIEAL